MLKLASLASMIGALRWWSIVVSPRLGFMSSSNASGGRRYSGRGFAGTRPSVGSSPAPASPAVSGDLWSPHAVPAKPEPRTGIPSRTDPPSRGELGIAGENSPSGDPSRVKPNGAGGANVDDVGPWFGIATGTDGAAPATR